MGQEGDDLKVLVLGSGQDTGIPHTGCYCEVCGRARKQAKSRRSGPSLALIDKKKRFCYLIDCSPDFKHQLDRVHREIGKVGRGGKIPVSGILLTHAHHGHVAGLWHLGREGVDERDVPVYCSPKMAQFLSTQYPFSLLVRRGNIALKEFQPNEEFDLEGLKVTPISVIHRSEIGDASGYLIETKKRLVYIPDVDRWTGDVLGQISRSDVALIDGTFYSRKELPRYGEVPHPPVEDTVKLMEKLNKSIWFTHLNHTNALNRSGPEKRSIESKGFRLAYDGLSFQL